MVQLREEKGLSWVWRERQDADLRDINEIELIELGD